LLARLNGQKVLAGSSSLLDFPSTAGGEMPVMMNQAAPAQDLDGGAGLDLRVGDNLGGDLVLQNAPAVAVGAADVAIAAGEPDAPDEIAPQAPVVDVPDIGLVGDALVRPNLGAFPCCLLVLLFLLSGLMPRGYCGHRFHSANADADEKAHATRASRSIVLSSACSVPHAQATNSY
jgi:hypothetical protein